MENNDTLEVIQRIPLDKLRPYPDHPFGVRDDDMINEMVELIVETVCSTKKYIRVAGSDFPAEVVRSRLMKLNASHIEFVISCLKENTTKVRNIKQYLLTTLYNAPTTIDSYYSTLVQHDLYGSPRE